MTDPHEAEAREWLARNRLPDYGTRGASEILLIANNHDLSWSVAMWVWARGKASQGRTRP